MNNLAVFNNDIFENHENAYLYFKLGENKYALKVEQVMEIIKLPTLDYPQKLANNSVGLLKYNNFTINILDLRFYLDIEVTPYSVSNKILIVKTDETIFGLIIDNALDIFSLDSSNAEMFLSSENQKIINSIYKKDDEIISIIDLNELETVLKNGVQSTEIYVPSLFPKDDNSQYEFKQRSLMLQQKNSAALTIEMFSQDQFISFSLAKNLYCINLEYVQEFLKDVSITKIPCNLNYIVGLIAIKGDFITIINLDVLLNDSVSGISKPDFDKNNVIVIDGGEYSIGIIVDEISGIINIPEELIKKDSKNPNKNILSEVILGETFYTVLNIRNILSDERLFINETV